MSSDATPPPVRPFLSRAGAVILPAVALIALLADQGSKMAVQQHFQYCDNPGQTIIPNWLAFTYTCNSGAAFGLLANATLLFVLIALVVIGVIVAYFRFLPANRPWLRLSLGLQLGGALGNLIDRLRQGYVVDFISIKSLPVFNIADSCIVIGVIILAYHLLVVQGQTALAEKNQPPSSENRLPISHQQSAMGDQPSGEG